jgi:hypothetical protein
MGKLTENSNTLFISTITLLIGAFVGLYFDSVKSRYDNKVDYLDVRTRSVENYINTPIAKDELNITWRDNNISNISSLSIEMYNFSDADFENVPVQIELKSKDKKDIKVIAYQVIGESGNKDLVEENKPINEGEKATYSFNSKLVNRTDKETPNITLTFLFADSLVPDLAVFVTKKGVRTREYNSSNADFISGFEMFVIIIIVIFSIGVYSIYEESRKKRNSFRWAAEAIEHKMMSDNDGNPKIRDVLHELREYQWNKISWYKKIISVKPKREDLFF